MEKHIHTHTHTHTHLFQGYHFWPWGPQKYISSKINFKKYMQIQPLCLARKESKTIFKKTLN